MHRTSGIRSSLLAVVLGAALVAPAGAATPDAWITTKTKLALLTTEGISGTAIKVDTVLGRVTLHGKVGSTEEKTKAETIAQKIDGAKSVHNLLQVVAIIPGVRQVASEVQSPETLADAEIWREATPPPASEEQGVWDTASDMWITSATKMRLLADSQTPALDINVDTWDGVVTLFGIVPSPEAKAAAEAAAHKVSGVKRVENELQVVASAKQAAVQVRDEEVEREVKKAFDTPAFKDITVEVKNGIVRLTGTVSSGARRLEAAVAARAIPGVRAVEDDLRLAAAGH